MAEVVQSDYRRRINTMQAGQVADTMPCFRESGILKTSDDGTDYAGYPTSLPFGFACGWVGENEVARRILYKSVAKVRVGIDNDDTTLAIKENTYRAGIRGIQPGDYIKIGTEIILVTGIGAISATPGAKNLTIVRSQINSSAAGHNADADIYLLSGPSNFAGVAVTDRALPGTNSPTDTYNHRDIVSVGSSGDFVVVCDGQVSRGDGVSVNVGSSADDYGKFSNKASSDTTNSHIGIPGAVFMTNSVQETPYGGVAADAEHLAVVRLNTQPR